MNQRYESEGYYFKRKLSPKIAGTIALTGFSVCIGLSGEYFGWNAGLEHGWNNMLIAVLISAIMYSGLILSICELCCALPFTNGPGFFAQTSFNVGLGALTSTIYALNYCLLAATILIAIANSISVASLLTSYLFLFMICLLAFIIESSPKLFFNLTFCLALYAFLILFGYLCFTFYFLVTSNSSFATRDSSTLDSTATKNTIPSTYNVALHHVLACYPYACWFFIGLEAFPTAAEEADSIIKSSPKASFLSYVVVFILAIILLSASPIENGAFVSSVQPLIENFMRMIDVPVHSQVASVLKFTCLFPSLIGAFCVAIYAASRHVYTLSRAGIIPPRLSFTFHGAPLNAVILALVLVLVIVSITELSEKTTLHTRTHDATLRVGVWLGSIGYAIVCASYIALRYRMPTLPRPFHSPFRTPGALLSLVISSLFGILGPFYLDGIFYSIVTSMFVGMVVLFSPYYLLVASRRLAEAPEKLFIRHQIHQLYGRPRCAPAPISFTFPSPMDKTKIISITKSDATKIISATPPPIFIV